MSEKDKLIENLINLQFEYANVNKTYKDCLVDENWYLNNSINQEIYDKQFKPIAIDLIKKTLRCKKEYAEKQFSWFTLAYSLRFN
jgi:hypothetical protein